MDGLTRPDEIAADQGPDNVEDTKEIGQPAANDQPVFARIETPPPPGPGAVLRVEREKRGYSVDDVATALKLAPRQVVAIEADDFDALRGQTFARGFVRNYARLFQLDPEPLMARIKSSAPSVNISLEPRSNASGDITVAGGSQGPVVAGGLAVLALVVVAVVGTYGQWLGGDPKTRDERAPDAKRGTVLSQTSGLNAPPQSSPLSASLSLSPVANLSAIPVPAEVVAASAGQAQAVATPVVANPAAPAATASANVAPSVAPSPVTPPNLAPVSATVAARSTVALSAVAANKLPATPSTAANASATQANTAAVVVPKPASAIVAKTSGTMMSFITPKPATSGTAATPAATSTAAARNNDLSLSTAVVRGRNDKRMVLSFEEDAWVEVRDGEGKVVFSQLNTAGSNRVVEGQGPLTFVVGNAHHVRLKVDDKPFDLKPHIGVTVARFSVQ